MLGQILPGLREVRAPLTAGYVWLLFAWLLWGELVPNRAEASGSLERVYDLEPIVAGFGIVVVLSVGAYVVGSIAIDTQDWIVHRLPDRLKLPITAAGKDRLNSLLPTETTESAGPPPHATDRHLLEQVGRSHLDQKKNLLKIRILDVNPALHSEVDRPDAEARFRTALWPPLSAVVLHFAFNVSQLWLFALVIPAALLVQSRLLTCQANDALLTALVARETLRDDVRENIKRAWEMDESDKTVLEDRTRRPSKIAQAAPTGDPHARRRQ